MIVTMYGSAAKTCSGIEVRMTPNSPTGGVVRMAVPSDPAMANRIAAPNAPSGVQRPKMSAARAMKPRPFVMPDWKELPKSIVNQAPARPANSPPMRTLR